jgi:uncharacterized protein YndB with AHSA1/START domain
MPAASTALTIATPSDREIVMTRVFDARRTEVYEGFTSPALLKHWLAVRGLVMNTVESDTQVGGRYRFEGAKPGGPTVGWGGEFREIVPGRRIVQTEAFDGYPGEALNTTTFEERDGRTVVTISVTYPSREIRDAVLATGMTEGAGEAYDRLQRLLNARG